LHYSLGAYSYHDATNKKSANPAGLALNIIDSLAYFLINL
jgi:hypothetical protein